MNVTAKSVLITGANRGIGLDFVSQLLKLPKSPKWLFAACRNPDQATELQKIAASNSSVKVLKLEVTSADDIKSAVNTIAKDVGDEGLNLIINNAGMEKKIFRLDDVTEEGMMEHFRVNSVAPLMVCKAFLPMLKKAAAKSSIKGLSVGKAAVINMSSVLGSIQGNTSAGTYGYRASKTALNQIMRNVSIELKSQGILVVAIHPGWVQTEMGGPGANVSITDSVSSMLQLFGGLNAEKTGMFLNYTGESIPW